MKFQDPSSKDTGGIKKRDEHTNERADKPKAICFTNFCWGHKHTDIVDSNSYCVA